MIGEICAEIKNYFTFENDKYVGDWTIENGIITPSFDIPTDYIRIVGSRLNDGVHKVSEFTEHPLEDESFHGAIWIMSPPKEFLALVAEIEAWQDKYGGADSSAMSPYSSESFGGYQYIKSESSAGSIASNSTWEYAYANRLKRYRRIRV